MRMYSLGNILPHVAPTLFAWPDPPGYISLKRRRLAAFVSPSGIIPDLWVHWDGATSLMAGGGYGTSSWGIFQIIPDLVRTKETHMTKHQRFSNCLICFQDLTWLKHADAEGPRNDLGHTCHCKIKPWIWPFWICGSFKTWSFLFLEKYEKCCSLLFVRKKTTGKSNDVCYLTSYWKPKKEYHCIIHHKSEVVTLFHKSNHTRIVGLYGRDFTTVHLVAQFPSINFLRELSN